MKNTNTISTPLLDTFQKMAKAILLFACYFSLQSTFAQAPTKMSYQAVIRNSSNALVTNAPVGIKIEIFANAPTGTLVYAETHTVTTNGNGLATLQIGAGTPTAGSLATIEWWSAQFFLTTSIDVTGGSSYTITSSNELLSVPYARYAEYSDTAKFALNSWGLLGNNVIATDFIGSTNNADLVFKRKNLKSGQIGLNNTAFGYQALSFSPITATFNTAFGTESLKSNQGANNTAVGYESSYSNTIGNFNTAIGYQTLVNNTFGSRNTALGWSALLNVTTGSNNIGIGDSANVPSPTSSNQLSIGNVIYGTNMGNTATGTVGIGVPVPNERLEVAGKTKTTDLQVTNGAGANKTLVSDATGNATWQNSNINTGVHIVRTSNQIIPSSVDTKIDFVTEITDDANAFDLSTDEWTVTSTGFYHVYAAFNFSTTFPANQVVELIIKVNGVLTKYKKHIITGNESFDITADLKLNTNDKISLDVYQSSGASQSLSAIPSINYFTGYKIY